MKPSLMIKPAKHNRLNVSSSWRLISGMLIVLLFSGVLATAQSLPVVSVRFNNPQFDCPTQTYCLDVEFQSTTADDTLFGMNLRFFYDDNILEYLGAGEFALGYSMPEPAEVTTGAGGVFFGLAGPLEWVNGSVQLTSETNIELPVGDEWVKLFKVCFHVDDPASLRLKNFCPSIIWDLQENPPEIGGGFLPGDDGVVMTVVDPTGIQESLAATEVVVQFNWAYGGNPNGYGLPVSIICISTICGYIIPVSNWALFLGIGLMVLATLFIYRRRMS